MGKVLQFPVKKDIESKVSRAFTSSSDLVAYEFNPCAACGKYHMFTALWSEHEKQPDIYTRVFTCPETYLMVQATINKGE